MYPTFFPFLVKSKKQIFPHIIFAKDLLRHNISINTITEVVRRSNGTLSNLYVFLLHFY